MLILSGHYWLLLVLIQLIDVSAECPLYFVSMISSVWSPPAMGTGIVLKASAFVTHHGWEQSAGSSTAPCIGKKSVLVMAIVLMVSENYIHMAPKLTRAVCMIFTNIVPKYRAVMKHHILMG